MFFVVCLKMPLGLRRRQKQNTPSIISKTRCIVLKYCKVMKYTDIQLHFSLIQLTQAHWGSLKVVTAHSFLLDFFEVLLDLDFFFFFFLLLDVEESDEVCEEDLDLRAFLDFFFDLPPELLRDLRFDFFFDRLSDRLLDLPDRLLDLLRDLRDLLLL